MPVPTQITDLSTTAASNSPAGTDSVLPNLDDYLRAHASFIAQIHADKLAKSGGTMTGALTLSGAPTVNLHASTKKYVDDGLATKSDTSHTHSWDVITNKGLNEGTNTQDPNATQFHQIVTNHANSPDSGYFWHITTTFYGALTGSRAQIAVQYSDMARVYARSYFSGTWQPWVRCDLGETSTQSILSPGYQKLPGGLIVQWGTTGLTSDATPAAITFPIAFPTVCRSVQLTTLAASSGNWGNCIASGVTTSGFTARRYSGSSNVADAYWTALGF